MQSASSTAQAATTVFTTIVEVCGPGERGRARSALPVSSSAFVGRRAMWNSARPKVYATVRVGGSQLAVTENSEGAVNT